jgi:hypothetical protein
VLHQIGQFHISVHLHKIRPNCGNFPQMAVDIVKVHEALGEDVPLFYEIKLLATQRMKGMRDLNLPLFFPRIGCNREGI